MNTKRKPKSPNNHHAIFIAIFSQNYYKNDKKMPKKIFC